MTPLKTVQQREKELQSLLVYPEGRKKLEELQSQYYVESGKYKPTKASTITYILVHERQWGLITR